MFGVVGFKVSNAGLGAFPNKEYKVIVPVLCPRYLVQYFGLRTGTLVWRLFAPSIVLDLDCLRLGEMSIYDWLMCRPVWPNCILI